MNKTLVIIITYNGMQWIPDVLAAIGKSPHYDVWVRDNGSTDKTREFLKCHASVSFTQFGSNIGFGCANNEGLRFALENKYDSVFLQNQDCKISKNTLIELRNKGLKNPHNVTCPVQMNWDGIGANFNFDKRYAPQWKTAKRPFDVGFINAAAWFIPSPALRKSGGFNPVFFMYGEDNDWGRRLQKNGGKFTVQPELCCFHQSSIQSNQLKKLEVNRRIILSLEVTEYFFSHYSFKSWKNGLLLRAIQRSLHRKQLFNTATLINPIAEFLVYHTIQKERVRWEEIRQELISSPPFLSAG